MEWDIVPYWFEVMILNSIIWVGDNAAPANFPRYEKEKIAGGITLCVVRGEAAATASDVVASLSRWLFAFQLLLVLLLLCFSYFLFVFQRLILLLLLLALFVFARSRRLGFSPAELWLAVGAGEDDACLVPLGWGGLPRPGWLWASRERGRGRAMKITLLAELHSVIRLWRVSFPGEISIIWRVWQCDKMTSDMKVKLNVAH